MKGLAIIGMIISLLFVLFLVVQYLDAYAYSFFAFRSDYHRVY